MRQLLVSDRGLVDLSRCEGQVTRCNNAGMSEQVSSGLNRRGFLGARRLAMAGGALQIGVPAGQRKMRLLRMIECPLRPAVRRMAGLAFLS